MEPLAYVKLGLNAPDEVVGLLRQAGIEAVVDGEARPGTPWVRFANSQQHDGKSPTHTVEDGAAGMREVELRYDSPYATACFIICHALNLDSPFLTANATMFSIVRDAIAAARSQAGIVIEGETGTGKETLLNLIHAASGGGPASLLRMDCTTSELNDDQLDALAGAVGERIEISATERIAGTILFDHIDGLSPAGQIRLVEIKNRLGTRGEPFRFAATTTHPLAQQGRRGSILPELLEHFQVTLTIPPLRHRREDILMFARHFFYSAKPFIRITAGAMRMLCDYPFPGNVRELQNLAVRLGVLCAGVEDAPITRDDMLDTLISGNFAGAAGASLWKLSPRSLRREVARQALSSFSGDTMAAARSLGLEPYALAHFATTTGPKARKPRASRDP